jgi:hypothetical protein
VGRDENDLRWAHNHHVDIRDQDTINCLSWGSREELLIAGTKLWLYNLPLSEEWRLVWRQAVSSPVSIAHFSNDAELIASCGEHDRLVKIWRRHSHELDSTRFDVSYLPHPTAVTDLHWRKPWHAEQNLDSLLYTICSDNQVRLWTYSDPHSLSVMQLIATVDTNASIQPRRLSVGSLSHRRYVFIIDSRDLSRATERAVQSSKQKQVDHAMEHLVEVANRSPEVCVVLDGVGHMSAWGLENAGYKSKRPPIVFNVALVDDVKMQLCFDVSGENNYVRFCTFAGGLNAASLSVLVHSYTGQVDWYESPIATFFDTSPREQRVQLMSSWSGHDLSIDHIARGTSGQMIMSWTDEGQAILWSQTISGALKRSCEVSVKNEVISMLLLDQAEYVLILHEATISLWNVAHVHGVQVASVSLLKKSHARAMQLVPKVAIDQRPQFLAISYDDSTYEIWQLSLPRNTDKGQSMKDSPKVLKQISKVPHHYHNNTRIIPCDIFENDDLRLRGHRFGLVTASSDGKICGYSNVISSSCTVWDAGLIIDTNIGKPGLLRATYDGFVAMTNSDRKAIFIWNMNQAAYEWQHEFSGPDHIQKIAWTTTPNGHLLLFVSFSYHALVIGQMRFIRKGTQYPWRILQDISLRDFTTNYIGDVSWLPSGDLAIGAGNQIFVLECICNKDSSDTIKSKRGSLPSYTVIEKVEYENSTIPVFHTSHLERLLMQGKHTRVLKIILRFYEKVKYYSEGDSFDSLLGLDMSLFSDHDEDVTTGSIQNNDVKLSDIAGSLQDYLTRIRIPYITRADQTDLSEFITTFIAIDDYRSSLDENALRYLYSLYSTSSDKILPWSSFVFASQSSSQQALLELIIRKYDNKISWEIARRTGLFIWLEDLTTLQEQFENVARTEYVKHEDRNPVDCSLYYLALNKKPVLQGLWRRTVGIREKENTVKLLANNFDDPKWKSTALKNAYALLSRRRFEYAAAFFLLGNSLKDAVYICVNQLDDPQLAIAIARVWDKDREQSDIVFHELLEKVVLPRAVDDEEGRWIACWAYIRLNQLDKALQVIVRHPHEVMSAIDLTTYDRPLRSMCFRAKDPDLSILYLRVRDTLIKQGKWTERVIGQSEEHSFILQCVNWYVRAGMDVLALHLAKDWKFMAYQQVSDEEANRLATPVIAQKTMPDEQVIEQPKLEKKQKPKPTQFIEPSANSLLDSFGF